MGPFMQVLEMLYGNFTNSNNKNVQITSAMSISRVI